MHILLIEDDSAVQTLTLADDLPVGFNFMVVQTGDYKIKMAAATATLDYIEKNGPEFIEDHHQAWVEKLKKSPIALVPEKANEQHYEVPPAFFENALGKHLKYSSGYWPSGIDTLDDSEFAMLELSAKRAVLSDGFDIVELGCGWGSLTLYMA